jgi:hypothetical protein
MNLTFKASLWSTPCLNRHVPPIRDRSYGALALDMILAYLGFHLELATSILLRSVAVDPLVLLPAIRALVEVSTACEGALPAVPLPTHFSTLAIASVVISTRTSASFLSPFVGCAGGVIITEDVANAKVGCVTDFE